MMDRFSYRVAELVSDEHMPRGLLFFGQAGGISTGT